MTWLGYDHICTRSVRVGSGIPQRDSRRLAFAFSPLCCLGSHDIIRIHDPPVRNPLRFPFQQIPPHNVESITIIESQPRGRHAHRSGKLRPATTQNQHALKTPHQIDPASPEQDADSVFKDENVGNSTASVSSTILAYRKLHGRTYHNFEGVEYWYGVCECIADCKSRLMINKCKGTE